MEDTNEPETFIIQNVTLSPHYVSDIRLQFDPLSVIDLTWEESKAIRASKDLRNSLRTGILRKISQEQWDKILEKQTIREKKELLRQQQNDNLRTIEVDGEEKQVEMIDVEKGNSNKENTVSTAGYANDSMSYAVALDIAQQQAELRGDELSVEEFAERVKNNPNLVPQLISQARNLAENSTVSGDSRRGKAYVAYQADENGSTSIKQMNMTNLNRDGYIASGLDINQTPIKDAVNLDADYDDLPVAEAIDLEDSGDMDKGSVRRL
jgi:hypothetical protein